MKHYILFIFCLIPRTAHACEPGTDHTWEDHIQANPDLTPYYARRDHHTNCPRTQQELEDLRRDRSFVYNHYKSDEQGNIPDIPPPHIHTTREFPYVRLLHAVAQFNPFSRHAFAAYREIRAQEKKVDENITQLNKMVASDLPDRCTGHPVGNPGRPPECETMKALYRQSEIILDQLAKSAPMSVSGRSRDQEHELRNALGETMKYCDGALMRYQPYYYNDNGTD